MLEKLQNGFHHCNKMGFFFNCLELGKEMIKHANICLIYRFFFLSWLLPHSGALLGNK